MSKTNWQDPLSTEMRSTQISGLQDAVGKLEVAVDISIVVETGVALTEIFISEIDRYRIYQAPVGKRNWLLVPAPVIKKNGAVVMSGFTLDYGGGAIIVVPTSLATDVFTADVTYTGNVVAFATVAQGVKADNALPAASYTAADILTKIKTVDGAGSGLDADLLDGLASTDFATAAQGALATNALPKVGGTMTGILTAQTNTSYTVAQLHNVILNTTDAVLGSMNNGDLWIKYV